MESKDSISRNRVRFSGCRKFAGESSLIFDDPEVVVIADPSLVQEVELPGDALLTLELSSDLRLDRAAVGDAVTAVLRSDVKRAKQTVIKKGALARGRVILLDRSSSGYAVAILFQELEWKGGHAVMRARFEGLGGLTFAGRPRIVLAPDGVMQVPESSRSMKGETLLYRTLK
jgi:hypothetical protein